MTETKKVSGLKPLAPIPSEVAVVPSPQKDLLVWSAPARPFKKRNREYFTTVAAIVFLVSVILFFIKELALIAVIIAMMFLSYVLATVEPEQIKHKITTRGIITKDRVYKWEDFTRFWISDKWGHQVLNLETFNPLHPRVQLLLGNLKKKEVEDVVQKYLILDKPTKNFLDKSADWLQKKVPLETEQK